MMPLNHSTPKEIRELYQKSNPNMDRIPIPKVQKGIDLIAGRRFPIIICECGNIDQRAFGEYIATDLTPKKDKPWQYTRRKVRHVICKKCRISISKFEFDMKAQKLVEDSKKKQKVTADDKVAKKKNVV